MKWWLGPKSCNFPPLVGQGLENLTIQQGDPKLGRWLLPKGHVVYFHLRRHRIEQDRRMFSQVLYPRVCSH